MTSWLVLTLTLLVVFVSTFIRATLGFGNALLAMPLLALTVGLRFATPLVAFLSATIAVLMLAEGWRHIDVRAAWRLVLASCLGIPVGLWVLTSLPEAAVKAVLGVVLILFGGYNLLQLRLPRLQSRGLAYSMGFVAGILGGAYNTNGPPVIIYGMLAGWSPDQFRATLQSYFLLTGFVILVGHGLAGLWTLDVLWLYLLSLPVMALAYLLGSLLNRRVSSGSFNRMIYAVLIVIGVVLII